MLDKVTSEDLNMILTIEPKEIDKRLLIELFANKPIFKDNKFVKVDKKYEFNVKVTIPIKTYNNNLTPINTTLGRLIVNTFLFKEYLHNIVGYVNEPMTGDVFNKIESKISTAILLDQITIDQHADYKNRVQALGFGSNSFISASITSKTSKPLDSVIKERDKLLKENEDAINSGDVVTSAKIEQHLVKMAEKELGDDPGMELYKSGSKIKMGNNYKALMIMKGPLANSATGEYRISQTDYSTGIKKDEIYMHGDSNVIAAYAKGVETQTGGYLAKKYFAAFQSIVLDKKGSECGSVRTHKILLTNYNYSLFKFRYIKVGNRLVLLDIDNIQKYIGKYVDLRDPIYCISDKVCNFCAGDLYYMLGIDTIGLTSARIPGTILNDSMKKIHDSSIKLHKVDMGDLVM